MEERDWGEGGGVEVALNYRFKTTLVKSKRVHEGLLIQQHERRTDQDTVPSSACPIMHAAQKSE